MGEEAAERPEGARDAGVIGWAIWGVCVGWRVGVAVGREGAGVGAGLMGPGGGIWGAAAGIGGGGGGRAGAGACPAAGATGGQPGQGAKSGEDVIDAEFKPSDKP